MVHVPTVESRRKISEANKKNLDEKYIREQYTNEKKSLLDIASELNVSKPTILNRLRKMGIKVRTIKEATRLQRSKRKVSAKKQGIQFNEWSSFVSFEPYCPRFNSALKEKTRNRDGRTCQICGKAEILNGRRLDVHHIDADKTQGCNGQKWSLTSLCASCHRNIHTKNDITKEFLLITNRR